MKSVVTGGAGFIGSHIVDHLLELGSEVTVVDNLSTGNLANLNKNAHLIEQSIETVNLKKIFQDQDFIFHTAALPRIQPSFVSPEDHDIANIQNTVKVVRAAKEENVKKIIFSGSSAVYGNPINTPTSENEPVNCLNPYALQKYTAEQYGLLLGRFWSQAFVSLRYFNPYGPRSFNEKNPDNAYSSVIGIFQNQFENNSKLTITGDGSQLRDFIYVGDLAKANIEIAESNIDYGIYNVGFGKAISVLEVAKQISDSYEFIPERSGEAEITLADNNKLKNQTNWIPSLEVSDYIANWKKSL